jgi:hypothetical protein
LQSLAAFTLPAGTLVPDGQALRVTIAGHMGADGGTLRVLWGGTVLVNLAVGANAVFQETVYIVRQSAGHQTVNNMNVVSGAALTGASNDLTKDETQPLDFVFQGNTAGATPVFLDQCLIELLGG